VRHIVYGLMFMGLLLGASRVQADEESYTGTLNTRQSSRDYPLNLQAAESVLITAETLTGDLDLRLTIKNTLGTMLAENDDRNADSYDPALGFTASSSGTYILTVSQYGNDSGTYHLTITQGDESVLAPLADLTAINLSGTERILDTPNFRIHYTYRGEDATTEAFAQSVAQAVEYVYQIEITQLGWPAPMPDGYSGGDSRMDVYLMDLMDDSGDGAMGLARPGDQYGDNPNTPEREKYATSTMLRLDNDFAELEGDRLSPIELMRVTVAHEFHHAVQHGYDANEPMGWYFEATAVWMEQAVYPKLSSAVYYVESVYDFPELCFGTADDPDGLQMYGEWMFLQSLADIYGGNVVQELWVNIARLNGFAALQQTLVAHDDDLVNALVRYRLRNIVRDYKQASLFENATVWLEDSIHQTGDQITSGKGVQPLGANYIQVSPELGTFRVELADDGGVLQLWAMGIRGRQAESFALGRGAVLDSSAYDNLYLMVMNPLYENGVDDCQYTSYHLNISPASAGDNLPVEQVWDARWFTSLKRGG
jgi:hypothetical protein